MFSRTVTPRRAARSEMFAQYRAQRDGEHRGRLCPPLGSERALGRRLESGDQREQRRLAGTVRPDQPGDEPSASSNDAGVRRPGRRRLAGLLTPRRGAAIAPPARGPKQPEKTHQSLRGKGNDRISSMPKTLRSMPGAPGPRGWRTFLVTSPSPCNAAAPQRSEHGAQSTDDRREQRLDGNPGAESDPGIEIERILDVKTASRSRQHGGHRDRLELDGERVDAERRSRIFVLTYRHEVGAETRSADPRSEAKRADDECEHQPEIERAAPGTAYFAADPATDEHAGGAAREAHGIGQDPQDLRESQRDKGKIGSAAAAHRKLKYPITKPTTPPIPTAIGSASHGLKPRRTCRSAMA